MATAPEKHRPVDGREELILFFKVGGRTFGVRLTEVVRIEYVEPYAAFAPDIVFTDCELPRGGSLPIVNLHKFFGIKSSPTASYIQALIIFEDEGDLYGVVADEVDKILPAGQAPEVSFPSILGDRGEKLYGGFFTRDKKLVPSLNLRQTRVVAGGEATKAG